MKHPPICITILFILFYAWLAHGNTLYVDLNSTNPTPPYSDWSTAATNIQDAIDASTDGDLIWVTNGVYQAGGKVMAGNLTNRVALDKAVTVQSVNGPLVTTIAGIGATNNGIAVRCAWLTNDAALVGFTLMRGATRNSGDQVSLESGGGVWCASSDAVVSGCMIVSNSAVFGGSGAYQGTLNNCFVSSNSIFVFGGAVHSAILNNCTVVSNISVGLVSCQATNSICYYNGGNNYSGGGFSYSCVTPVATGTGNFTTPPIFFADRIHLAIGSPGIAAGTTSITGTDIFGRTWANPPSVGCAETAGLPYVSPPQVQLTGVPVGFTIGNAFALGTAPLSFAWLKDGAPLQDDGHFAFTQTTNLVATGVSFADAGNYQLVVSNASGMATSAVVQVVIHCVNVANTTPAAPYTSWVTAATNIQDAIIASAANEIVMVTNGVYAAGGKSMDNTITNRVSVDKAILVQSVNGPDVTTIQGAWDPATMNGPGAIRCVWMTNNSILKGFTITGGATRDVTGGSANQSMNGGGVWSAGTNTVVDGCFITANFASNNGGGAYSGTLNFCTITGNKVIGSGTAGAGLAGAGSGGGAARSRLNNCVVASNVAVQSDGGGAYFCNATNTAFINNQTGVTGSGVAQGNYANCTIVNNTCGGYGGWGGAASSATLINCVVYGNTNIGIGPVNSYLCNFSYSDTDPLPSGTGNIDVDPQLLADGIHLAQTSPCIGAGTNSGLSGKDIDNQPWNNPPSIGCDEWQPMPAIGIQPIAQAGSPAPRALSFPTLAAGQAPFNYFWFKDGTLIQDNVHYANSTTPDLVVNDFQPEDAGLYQLIVSNSFGSVTSHLAQVVIHAADAASANPAAPFSTWQTAAATIQDAIDAANPHDIVLVTNGIYSTGGKVMSGDLTNRVALNKALTVLSVNGYAATAIEGQWDSPATTNGPGAIRCAWIGDGAVLNGFTLRNGATRGGNTLTYDLHCGGGAWLTTNAIISNCVLSNNSARWAGGGVAFGTVNNCFLTYNSAQSGSGVYFARINNSTLRENHCFSFISGGVDSCISRNCILVDNYYPQFGVADSQLANYPSSSLSFLDKFTNCCTSPLPFRGTNNVSASPMFLNVNGGFALAPASPCIGAGDPLFATGYDLDGEPYANPPTIGCDELIATNLTGPLSVALQFGDFHTLAGHRVFFASLIEGRASELAWSFGDGPIVTNLGATASHYFTNAGIYLVNLTAYNADHPAGVTSSNVTITISSLLPSSIQTDGVVSNAFQLSFTTQSQGIYAVQYTTNLAPPVTWQTLKQFLFSTNGETMTIRDPAITNGGVRFYRVQGQ